MLLWSIPILPIVILGLLEPLELADLPNAILHKLANKVLNLLGVGTSVLVALKNCVASIHGAGIKKAVVPEFNHEKSPAPVHQARKLQ